MCLDCVKEIKITYLLKYLFILAINNYYSDCDYFHDLKMPRKGSVSRVGYHAFRGPCPVAWDQRSF